MTRELQCACCDLSSVDLETLTLALILVHGLGESYGYEELLKVMTHKILNHDPKDEILKTFRLSDDDETGKISLKNLKCVAKELGEGMTDEELQEMIDEADRDGDGEVNEEDFSSKGDS